MPDWQPGKEAMDRELSEVVEVDWDAFHASTDVEFRSAILEAANRQREGVR